ncbi:MAG TPA: phytanoyl-CoA dioxygenase family protein, partial [Phycisphaerales bacterium]|nr:phytanoyl-CoA dioxygenase family protein [Phycisphaerales bacterium]
VLTQTQPDAFSLDGVAVLDHLVDEPTARDLTALAEPLLRTAGARRPGVRRVFEREPRLAAIAAEPAVARLMESLAGSGARVVRSILFDKSPETNWAVPWHHDPTIAVTQRLDAPGFGPWSIKDGEHHCQPPLDVLQSIVTIRIHLDPCPAEAGPLRVLRGSHRRGLLSDEQIAELAVSAVSVEAVTGAGGAAVMTPLSVHSSPRATMLNGRRRVLHLECSAMRLPHGLRWAEAP